MPLLSGCEGKGSDYEVTFYGQKECCTLWQSLAFSFDPASPPVSYEHCGQAAAYLRI